MLGSSPHLSMKNLAILKEPYAAAMSRPMLPTGIKGRDLFLPSKGGTRSLLEIVFAGSRLHSVTRHLTSLLLPLLMA